MWSSPLAQKFFAVLSYILAHKFLFFIVILVIYAALTLLWDWFEEKVSRRVFAGLSLVLVTLVYCTVFALTALGFKVRGRRLLPDFRKTHPLTYWTDREKTEPTLEYLKRQF